MLRNNPVRYTDPTGHCAESDDECNQLKEHLESTYGITITGLWQTCELEKFEKALIKILKGLENINVQDPIDAFWKLWGGTEFERVNQWKDPISASAQGKDLVKMYNGAFYDKDINGIITFEDQDQVNIFIAHELGDTFQITAITMNPN